MNSEDIQINIKGDHNPYYTGVLSFCRRNVMSLGLLITVLILILTLIPQFFSVQNITNVARQSSITGIIAVGMTFVVLAGGIDLSVGGILAVSGIVFSGMAKSGYSIAICLICAILVGVLVGSVNAIGIEFLAIPPFIMTLATSSMMSGIAFLICGGIQMEFTGIKDPMVDFLGNGSVGQIPGPFILFVVIVILSATALYYLPFGRYVYSVGSSFEGARLAGIRTTSVIIVSYIISGACASLGGVITACRLYVGHPVVGSTEALDAIAAMVLGGVSLSGGKGTAIGTMVGILLMTVVANVLNLLGISNYVQQVAKGIIIIIAILLTVKDIRGHIRRAWRGL